MLSLRCLSTPKFRHASLKAAPTPPPTTERLSTERDKRQNSQKTKNKFEWKWRSPLDNRIFELAGPSLLALAADPLLSIVDTIYIGRLGPHELGALGLNTAIFTAAFLIFNFLSYTTTPLVATAVASGNREKAGQATVQSLLLAVIIGTGLIVGLSYYVDPILAAMGVTDDIISPTKDYYHARLFAAPGVLLCLAGQGVFRGLSDTKTPLAITLAANSINLVLDPLFIFGLHMGVRGGAIATAMAEIFSAGAYCTLIWRQRAKLGLDCNIYEALSRTKADYLPFLESAGTIVLRTGALLAVRSLAASEATRLGSESIGAHQVVNQLWLIPSLLSDSLAIAATTIVATELASKSDKTAARLISDRIFELGGYLGGTIALLYTAMYPLMPYIFTDDAEVVSAIYSILPLAIFMIPINSAAFVLDGIFIGAREFNFLAIAMAVSSIVASGVILNVEQGHWGLIGVWCGQSTLMALRFVILSVRYNQRDGPIPPLD